MYVLLVLCLNAVFMQVVSYCSVRVVPGVTLVAGWRWPGPLPWWSCVLELLCLLSGETGAAQCTVQQP